MFNTTPLTEVSQLWHFFQNMESIIKITPFPCLVIYGNTLSATIAIIATIHNKSVFKTVCPLFWI